MEEVRERDLQNIATKQIARIVQAVEFLADNPFPPQRRKLRGSEREYRIQVGDCRVVYQVDVKANMVTIYHVRDRREAYRKR